MFNPIQKRFILFLGGCMVVRSLIAYISYAHPEYNKYLVIGALILAFSWLWIYFVTPRTTGPEVMGGSIWWNELRPVHAMLYLLFVIYVVADVDHAWLPLAVDVVVGLTAFLVYHGVEGNFSLLLE